jgi:hypothetical protein
MPVALYHRTLLRSPNSPVRAISPCLLSFGACRVLFISLALAILGLGLAGCGLSALASPSDPWAYEDLRALAEAGAGPPSLDLIALYTRRAGGDLQVRLDLLDLAFAPDGDLYLALDWKPGGTRTLPLEAEAGLDWDALLVLPVQGQPYALSPSLVEGDDFDPLAGLIPRVARIPWNDMIVVSFNPQVIPGVEGGYSLQAFMAPAGETTPVDSLGPVRSKAQPPGRAPILLAFWNSFPAYTPAQALRRWDGAHTGPFGGRHGLHVLLEAGRRARVPVMLLDLKTPDALSALDYLEGLEVVRELAADGLLILPDSLPGSPTLLPAPQAFPGWAVGRSAFESRERGSEFGLPPSPILYSPSLELVDAAAPPHGLPPYSWIAAPLASSSKPAQTLRWKNYRLLPLPPDQAEHQATPDGLSIELRRILLTNALAAQEGDAPLLVLGGDLVESAWGEPQSARASLSYIAAHPWIQPYAESDLLRLRPRARLELPSSGPGDAPFTRLPPGSASGLESPDSIPLLLTGDPTADSQIPARLPGRLTQALESSLYKPSLAQAAWHAYRSLFAPLPPEHSLLPALRASYAHYPELLLEASSWGARPGTIAACELDLGDDLRRGCILASERVFTAFDPLGGRLLALFAYSPAGNLHQLVAPTSQIIVGFGDPSTWDPAEGPGAEPAGVHGAFAGSPPPWELYTPHIEPGLLVLSSPDGGTIKTFSLLEEGLRVEYMVSGPSGRVQIPLALDPWERFNPGWGDRYQESSAPQSISWRMDDGPGVEVSTSARLSADFFNDSRRQMAVVEDPNFAYPPGHYLPLSMAMVDIQAEEDFSVEIRLLSE